MDQIEKNTVSSKNQLDENEYVSYIQENGTGLRVMFVGNSITRHGILPKIGWHWDRGMASSSLEKDYVHLLVNKINKTNPDATYCICQAANWERNYKNGSEYLYQYEKARDFKADLIIFRLVENCPKLDFDKEAFYTEYQNLIDYLNPTKKAKIILTTGFWKSICDETIIKVAEERGYPCVWLGDLGEQDEMKAIGLYEHSGVANHPGDLGMQTIADLIAEKL